MQDHKQISTVICNEQEDGQIDAPTRIFESLINGTFDSQLCAATWLPRGILSAQTTSKSKFSSDYIFKTKPPKENHQKEQLIPN